MFESENRREDENRIGKQKVSAKVAVWPNNERGK